MQEPLENNGLYIVQDGDTLTAIALKSNTNLNNLKRINNLPSTSTMLFPGQVLKLKSQQKSPTLEARESPFVEVFEDQELPPKEQSLPRSQSEIQQSQTKLPSSTASSTSTTASNSSNPPKTSSTSISRFMSNLFWKRNYNVVPSSPGKDVGEISSDQDSTPTPTATATADDLNFEKDVEEFEDDIPNEDFPTEMSGPSFRVVDEEFDAEVVDNFQTRTSHEQSRPTSATNSTKTTTTSNKLEENDPPVLLEQGRILSTSQHSKLAKYLPLVVQQHYWVLLYSVYRDGADLSTFFRRTRGHNTTLIVIEAMNGEIFGGLATEQWQINSKFYGAGHSFLFRFVNDEVVIYPWTMENDFIMWSSAKRIAMGGGGDGFGFVLDDDFLTAQSNSSMAFRNPPLTSYSGSFHVTNVEVWGFESIISQKKFK